MKKINLSGIQRPVSGSIRSDDKYFWIWLGNSTNYRFTSKKEAKAFLAKVNKELNFKMDLLNDLYVDIFRYYRRVYFSVDHTGKIEGMIIGINKSFEWIYFQHHHHSVVFHHMLNITESFTVLVKYLKDEMRKQNNWNDVRFSDVLIKKITVIQDEIYNFGLDHPAFHHQTK